MIIKCDLKIELIMSTPIDALIRMVTTTKLVTMFTRHIITCVRHFDNLFTCRLSATNGYFSYRSGTVNLNTVNSKFRLI